MPALCHPAQLTPSRAPPSSSHHLQAQTFNKTAWRWFAIPITCNASQNIVLAVSDTNKVGTMLVPACVPSGCPPSVPNTQAACCSGTAGPAGPARPARSQTAQCAWPATSPEHAAPSDPPPLQAEGAEEQPQGGRRWLAGSVWVHHLQRPGKLLLSLLSLGAPLSALMLCRPCCCSSRP